jgi:hypothetical protein
VCGGFDRAQRETLFISNICLGVKLPYCQWAVSVEVSPKWGFRQYLPLSPSPYRVEANWVLMGAGRGQKTKNSDSLPSFANSGSLTISGSFERGVFDSLPSLPSF